MDQGECSLDLDVVQPSTVVACSCTGACKTNRCVCRKSGQWCTRGKCKCRPSKCSQLKEEVAVDIDDIGGEVHSSDSEPEDYCFCSDDCNHTLCYCLAIKHKACEASCNCSKDTCKNRVVPVTSVSAAPTITVKEEVKEFCANSTKEELESMLLSVVEKCPQVWKCMHHSLGSSGTLDKRPPWCKCGKCREEDDPEDRICCNNK